MSGQISTLLAFIGLHALWVLLPIVPAVLIYWLFPATKMALGGPLSGLTVKASGAFAAYLIVLLVTSVFVHDAAKVVAADHVSIWKVKGDVQLQASDGQLLLGTERLQSLQVALVPELVTSANEKFFLRIPDIEGDLPLVTFIVPGFGSQSFDLNDEENSPVRVNRFVREIQFEKPVVIRQFVPQRIGSVNEGALRRGGLE